MDIYTHFYTYVLIYIYICMHVYIYIYIYMYGRLNIIPIHYMPDLPTNIVDAIGFDSSAILSLRGGIPRPTGDFPESLSQAMLVGIMLAGRLGILSEF